MLNGITLRGWNNKHRIKDFKGEKVDACWLEKQSL